MKKIYYRKSQRELRNIFFLIFLMFFISTDGLTQNNVPRNSEKIDDSLHFFVVGLDSLCITAPKMTTFQRDTFSHPKRNMVIYNVDQKACNIYSCDDQWKLYRPFLCGEDFHDPVNGQTYPTAFFRNQCWMLDNLKSDYYSDGHPICEIKNAEDWSCADSGAWCYYFNDSKTQAQYGKLYNYIAVNDKRGICPSGWIVPDFSAWEKLVETVCQEGKNPKIPDNENEQLVSSFNRKSSVSRKAYGKFIFETSIHKANYWTSEKRSPGIAYSIDPQYRYKRRITKNTDLIETGLLVRCLASDNAFYQRYCSLPDSTAHKIEHKKKLPGFLHLGFSIGASTDFLIIRTKDDLSSRIYTGDNDFLGIYPYPDYASIESISSKPEFGFTINFETTFELSKNFELRFMPEFAYGSYKLIYVFNTYTIDLSNLLILENRITQEKEIPFTYLSFPLEFKVKINISKKLQLYFVAGGQYSWDIASYAKRRKKGSTYLIKSTLSNVYVNAGVGLSFINNYGRFNIELKNKYSLFDNLVHEGTIYTEGIESIKTDIIQLSFSFD